MLKRLFILILLVLFFSCSDLILNKVDTNVKYSQYQAGNWGDIFNYTVNVKNDNIFPITGSVTIKVTCYDNSTYSTKVDFSEISGSSTASQSGTMNVDNKKFTDVEIDKQDFNLK